MDGMAGMRFRRGCGRAGRGRTGSCTGSRCGARSGLWSRPGWRATGTISRASTRDRCASPSSSPTSSPPTPTSPSPHTNSST
jgi:hypothetical protein